MTVQVKVHPNSKHPRIEADLFNLLQVYVNEPPVEGRANLAVIKALANYFGVAKSSVRLKRGATSKTKYFEIDR